MDFNRFRVMVDSVWKGLAFEFAYEQVATFRKSDDVSLGPLGEIPGGSEWVDLHWTMVEDEHFSWEHRFDRLKVSWKPTNSVELAAGRQSVSWATTLLLTPSDPFSPFSPADPFREFRSGVDAVRVRVYPGALSEVDIVVRPTRHDSLGDELTIAGRGMTTWNNWEVSGWGGSVYGDIASAFGFVGSFAGWSIRSESVFRRLDNDVVFRGTIGVDKRVNPFGRELYMIAEYQRDGLGVASPVEYETLLQSKPFYRGELQVLGRDEFALQSMYQINALLSVSTLGLWNLNDGSALVSPSFSYSMSDEASITGGVFLGLGDDAHTPTMAFSSEYGAIPTTLYFSFSLFF